jgi:hypothetical protein
MSSVKMRKSTFPCRLAEFGLVTDGVLRMAPLLGLPRVLADHGLDADAVIREGGCDPALFDDPDNMIGFAAVGRLLAHTAAVTGFPYPGLELGRRSGLDTLGALVPRPTSIGSQPAGCASTTSTPPRSARRRGHR